LRLQFPAWWLIWVVQLFYPFNLLLIGVFSSTLPPVKFKLVLTLFVTLHFGYFFHLGVMVTSEDIDPIQTLDLDNHIDLDRELTSSGAPDCLVQDVFLLDKLALLVFFRVQGIEDIHELISFTEKDFKQSVNVASEPDTHFMYSYYPS
jgi:hypothetical protein